MGQRYPTPPPAGSYTPAYVRTLTYYGGASGDDKDQATARSTDDYYPKTQAEKASMPHIASTLAVDVATPRGWIAPGAPYKPLPAAPVVSSIAPTTAAAGAMPLIVTITGTGFTPYSKVISGGGAGSPWDASAVYVSATQMKVTIDPRGAVAGTASIAVEDHDVLSNTDKVFTFT